MLSHLHVTDFTLVKDLSLDFSKGLTVLTGETGAGKSILLGALGLALGDRADADKVRVGSDKSEVSASFELEKLPKVSKWLEEADLGSDECIIRRVVTSEGRSRAYINGQLVTLTQLRALGDRLVDIHSQHEHQSLLKTQTHRVLLESFGKIEALAKDVRAKFRIWYDLSAELQIVQSNQDELNARYQLLSYQKEELDQVDVAEGECEDLEQRQKQLANATEIQAVCQQASVMCSSEDGSIHEQLRRVLQLLSKLPAKSDRVEQAETMLQSALIQVDEANSEIQLNLDTLLADDEDLLVVEQRLSSIYDIARKHRVSPKSLAELHNTLSEELAAMQSGDDKLHDLEKGVGIALVDYQSVSKRLSAARLKAATALTKAVNKQIVSLAMSHAHFEVGFTSLSSPSQYGDESLEFLISTVPGQAAKPLSKVASGGELSRISLSIQVVTAKTSIIPCLIFDEVDVGIGGETGDVVGRLLRTLGESSQVVCVTHLAQVASKAHQHLKVEKAISKKSAETMISLLSGEEKVAEIARMMGGAIESEQSLAHAREMLSV